MKSKGIQEKLLAQLSALAIRERGQTLFSLHFESNGRRIHSAGETGSHRHRSEKLCVCVCGGGREGEGAAATGIWKSRACLVLSVIRNSLVQPVPPEIKSFYEHSC